MVDGESRAAAMECHHGLMSDPAPDAFSCPRCGADTVASFYGPCDDCRERLRELFSGLGREVDAVPYEPKMNVVPNQVASKE